MHCSLKDGKWSIAQEKINGTISTKEQKPHFGMHRYELTCFVKLQVTVLTSIYWSVDDDYTQSSIKGFYV